MKVRHVFVIWKHPIFLESVRLLLNHPDVELVGATSDVTTAASEILDLQADTVLVEGVGSDVIDEVLHILDGTPWNVRIFSFNLDTNKLSVYHREYEMMGKAEDLLHLVLGEIS